MTNLSDFLKCKKVRCVDDTGFRSIKKGKEYELVGVTNRSVMINDDIGCELWLSMQNFEPVLETAIQATDKLDDTPMGTRTVNEFEVGDPVYIFGRPYVSKVRELYNSVIKVDESAVGYEYEHVALATTENYEMLCKLYPNIPFEKPPVILQGSDLAIAMLKRGDRRIYGYASDNSDNDPHGYECVVRDYNVDSGFGLIMSGVRYQFFKPCDPRTGNPLTSEVLDD